jgi:hypothetical protein
MSKSFLEAWLEVLLAGQLVEAVDDVGSQSSVRDRKERLELGLGLSEDGESVVLGQDAFLNESINQGD